MTEETQEQEFKKWLAFNMLTLEQLQTLTAARLLAYRKKYRSRLMSAGVCECCGEYITEQDRAFGAFADRHLEDIKTVLATKPHVER